MSKLNNVDWFSKHQMKLIRKYSDNKVYLRKYKLKKGKSTMYTTDWSSVEDIEIKHMIMEWDIENNTYLLLAYDKKIEEIGNNPPVFTSEVTIDGENDFDYQLEYVDE